MASHPTTETERTGALAPPTPAAAPGRRSVADLAFEPRESVRIGLIGAGTRQGRLVRSAVAVPHAQVVGIADLSGDAAAAMADFVAGEGKPRPDVHAGDDAVTALLARDDLDLVMIATPWDSHAPLAMRAMRAGHHVAVEVPAAVTLDDCWGLVTTSEETQRHCVILENCCYGRTELFALQVVRSGALGELLHAECSYTHDLRSKLLLTKTWRRRAHIEHDGNLYPTHGLGPVSSYFGVNRGDRLTRLVSMGSPSLGLQEWREQHLPADDPRQQEVYRAADINTSLVQTERGRSILLQHQVVGPRPYDRRNQVVGTNGIFTDYPPRIHLEDDPVFGGDRANDAGEDGHREEFRSIEPYLDRFQHPLWATHGARAEAVGGHGGMDYLMLHRLVESMRLGEVPDMDVYDAATWSAPAALSELSVDNGNAPVEFPDFTRGGWQTHRVGIR